MHAINYCISGDNMDDKQIGLRIKAERERKNLTQGKLAELAQISHRQSVGKIEDGERKIQAVELYSISKVLGVRPEFLLGVDKNSSITQPSYLWRNLNPESRTSWEQKFSGHIADLKYVESVLCLESTNSNALPYSQLDILKADDDSIYALADMIRGQLVLGAFPAESLFKTLEEKFNVRIFFVDLHNAGSAATTRSNNEAVIFLDMFEPPWRRIFSLAHELFHVLTWTEEITQKAQIDNSFHKKNERLADTFAAGLLMPYESLNIELKKVLRDGKLTYIDTISLSRLFGVSTQALLYRLANLRIITFGKAKEICSDSSFIELDRKDISERWLQPAKLSERFIRLAYQAYNAAKISKARLAEMCDVPLIDVDDLLAERGLEEIEDHEIQISYP
jgi:Zn-dependent peptidase ImmA (M78 family)/transcriptional regulator with XRE-family HTH domain